MLITHNPKTISQLARAVIRTRHGACRQTSRWLFTAGEVGVNRKGIADEGL